MDHSWGSITYRPTFTRSGDRHSIQCVIPNASQLHSLQKRLQECTKSILNSPYDPHSWLDRATTLLDLGYPELVLGDCCKARLLVDSENLGGYVSDEIRASIIKTQEKSQNPSTAGVSAGPSQETRRKDVNRKALILSIKASSLMHHHGGSKAFCIEGRTRFPDEAFFKNYLAFLTSAWDKLIRSCPQEFCLERDVEKGYYHLCAYPWMTMSMFQRGQDDLRSVYEGFLDHARDKCVLRRSKIRKDMGQSAHPTSTQADVFGVFAVKDFEAGEVMFEDPTIAAAVSEPRGRCDCCCAHLWYDKVILPCCDVAFCSQRCATSADQNYHRSLCGKDVGILSRRYTSANISSYAVAQERLLLRVLAISKQSQARHPLKAPLIGSLTATYGEDIKFDYNYEMKTVSPIKFLQYLGIDVFTDLTYDTWVIHTIQARLRTNQNQGERSGVNFEYVSPLRSFVNHSCRPNAIEAPSSPNGSMDLTVKARTAIRSGEELTLNYNGSNPTSWQADLLPSSLHLRREWNRPVLGGDCQCWLCLEQEKEEQVRKEQEREARLAFLRARGLSDACVVVLRSLMGGQ